MAFIANLIRATALALSSTSFLMTSACGADRRSENIVSTISHYKDGTYRATGQYGNLPSFLTVTLTLANGTITSVSVQTHATDPTSLDYQRRFAEAVPAVVIGKPIDEAHVSKLAGASGCPVGFNAAIDQIKMQASS